MRWFLAFQCACPEWVAASHLSVCSPLLLLLRAALVHRPLCGKLWGRRTSPVKKRIVHPTPTRAVMCPWLLRLLRPPSPVRPRAVQPQTHRRRRRRPLQAWVSCGGRRRRCGAVGLSAPFLSRTAARTSSLPPAGNGDVWECHPRVAPLSPPDNCQPLPLPLPLPLVPPASTLALSLCLRLRLRLRLLPLLLSLRSPLPLPLSAPLPLLRVLPLRRPTALPLLLAIPCAHLPSHVPPTRALVRLPDRVLLWGSYRSHAVKSACCSPHLLATIWSRSWMLKYVNRAKCFIWYSWRRREPLGTITEGLFGWRRVKFSRVLSCWINFGHRVRDQR